MKRRIQMFEVYPKTEFPAARTVFSRRAALRLAKRLKRHEGWSEVVIRRYTKDCS